MFPLCYHHSVLVKIITQCYKISVNSLILRDPGHARQNMGKVAHPVCLEGAQRWRGLEGRRRQGRD